MVRDKKTASTTTPPTYAAWRDAAAKDLIERHGLKINVRDKQLRDWYIRKLTPAEAAESGSG